MPWTYSLEGADGTFYVGGTFDLDRRIWEHNEGLGAIYTRIRRRRPVRLRWAAPFDRIDEAFAFEKQVQGWGRAKRIALIEGRLDDLPALARGRNRPAGGLTPWLRCRGLDKLDHRPRPSSTSASEQHSPDAGEPIRMTTVRQWGGD